MSPDVVNGNPPSVTKRKKNRDKKPPQPDFNTHFFPNADMTTYYSLLNYSNTNEPMSLPAYHYPHLYPGFSTPNQSPIMPSNDDYLSLPVVNLENELGKRRYSDPGPNDSDESSNSLEQKVFDKLTQQVQALRDSNKKLTREVMELRIELNLLKQHQNSRHFEREYEPGMLADIIREVRDAARVREDALLARVKHMIEEKQHNLNHLQLMGDNNKSRNNSERISKLEEQLKLVNVSHRSDESPSTCEDGIAARQVLELEREALELRKELQDTRAKKEEADQKVLQLDRRLSNILKRSDISDEDSKTNSIDSISMASSISQVLPRVTLSGPVTDL